MKSESFEMLSLKVAESQSASVQSIRFRKSTVAAAADALLSNIFLSFKSKIIKSEK